MNKKHLDLLLNIAIVQNQLILQRIDFGTMSEIPPFAPTIGLFKRENPAYQERVSVIETLETTKAILRNELNTRQGYTWWDIPWPIMEKFLVDELTEANGYKGWKLEHEYTTINKDSLYYLFLHESGHLNSYSYDTDAYEYDTFTQAEKDEALSKFTDKVLAAETALMLTNHDSLLYSGFTDKVYTMRGYLTSSEHLMWVDHFRSRVEDRVTDIHSVNTTCIKSNSKHFEAVYFAGVFCLNEKHEMTGFQLVPYALNRVDGDMPKAFLDYKENSVALTPSAAYLSMSPYVKAVPVSYCREFFESEFDNMNTASIYGRIFTLFANKLILD